MNLPINREKFSDLGLVYYELAGLGVFDFGKDGLAKANIEGDNLLMFPERSSMHKRVLGVLGG